MKIRNLAVIGALLTVLSAPAHALLINVGGTDYDVVTTEVTTANAAAGLLASTSWWGNQALALAITNALQDALGMPNNPSTPGIRGPAVLFAPENGGALVGYRWGGSSAIGYGGNGQGTFENVFLVERSVPAPAGFALMALGLAGLVLSRRRRTA